MNNQFLSAKLKELRKAHNFTQDYVASAIGTIRQTYSHYENGRRTPSSDILFKLAGLYNISVDDLMQLVLDIDRNEYYDIPLPSESSESLAGFLEYYSDPKNQRKYQFNTYMEKELLYYFDKISAEGKKELIEIAKLKVRIQKGK